MNPIAPNSMATHRSPGGILLPSTTVADPHNMGVFNAEQLAALQVAAAASAARFAAAAGVVTANPLAAQPNIIHQASLSAPTLPAFHQLPPVQPVAPLSSQMAIYKTDSEASDGGNGECIRMEQVEAALKSKPQRGRKRDDLSELERQELTRTRNREHAKTTRIRKKARHQELLEIEKRCEEVLGKSTLRDARRDAVCKFFNARNSMLHNFQASNGSHTVGGNPTSLEGFSCLESLVESTLHLQFDDGSNKGETILSAVERMRRFDEKVYLGVMEKFGDDNTLMNLLRYEIKGGEEGIALDFGQGALVEVEISLALPTKILLMSGVWRFRFGNGSGRIQSVSYMPMTNLLASSDRLQTHTIYPSTGSLDPLNHSCESLTENKQEDLGGGPGMNI